MTIHKNAFDFNLHPISIIGFKWKFLFCFCFSSSYSISGCYYLFYYCYCFSSPIVILCMASTELWLLFQVVSEWASLLLTNNFETNFPSSYDFCFMLTISSERNVSKRTVFLHSWSKEKKYTLLLDIYTLIYI